MPQIVLYGVVGTNVASATTNNGVPAATFRLASTHRFHSPKANDWVTGSTSWTTVLAYRNLAQNIQSSVNKGDRVIVTGRLSVRDWQSEDRQGREVEIIAEAVGPDLRSMSCKAVRNEPAARPIPEPEAPDGVDPVTGEIHDRADDLQAGSSGEDTSQSSGGSEPF